jgi:hypothetical protein
MRDFLDESGLIFENSRVVLFPLERGVSNSPIEMPREASNEGGAQNGLGSSSKAD